MQQKSTVEEIRQRFDVIVVASVLHHLRGAEGCRAVFTKFHDILRSIYSILCNNA